MKKIIKKRTINTKKPASKKTPIREKTNGLTISVVDVEGKATSKMNVPKEVFGMPVNKQMLAQSVRVYLANQRVGHANTKTRGEVEGSTRKIYRQKGTGRARHGAVRAPVFVGGGIVFGPKPLDHHLNMPAKMQKTALVSALSSQFQNNNIIIVDGLEALKAKTKFFAQAFTRIGAVEKTLLLTPQNAPMLVRATRNLSSIDVMPAQQVYPYAVLSHKKIVFTKDAMKYFLERFI